MASLKTLSATSMPPSRKMAPSSASKQLAIACLQKNKTESSTSIGRVSDPDPDWIRIQSGLWIRNRIRIRRQK